MDRVGCLLGHNAKEAGILGPELQGSKRSELPFGRFFSLQVTAEGEGTYKVRKTAVGGERGDSRTVKKQCIEVKQQ